MIARIQGQRRAFGLLAVAAASAVAPAAAPAAAAAVPSSSRPASALSAGGPQEEPLTLGRAVRMALQHHPSVAQALASEEAAAGALRGARSSLLPAVQAEGSLLRFEEPMVVAPLHGFDLAQPPEFDRALLQGTLSLGYTLFDGGARRARIGRAEAGVAGAEAGRAGATMDVALETAAAYLSVLSGEEVLEAALKRRAALEKELERVRQFLEEGKAARVDQLRVEAALARARAEEVSARSDLDVARGRLGRLIGRPLEASGAPPPVGIVLSAGPAPSREEALSRALESSPEMRAAAEALAAAKAGAREAAAAWMPTVRLGGGYADYGTLEGGHTLEWQASVKLSYPLFTGGARLGERERTVAEERRAAEGVRLARLAVEDAVEEALAAVAKAGARREALAEAVSQAEEVARIEALALEAGAGVQTDFLSAEAELFQSRAALAGARYGEVLARFRLARVMGELTPEWIEAATEVVR